MKDLLKLYICPNCDFEGELKDWKTEENINDGIDYICPKCKENWDYEHLDILEIPKLSEDWTEVNDNSINVPDELDPLLNRIGMQINFMLYSDKDKNLTICHILRLSEEFFHKYYTDKLRK